MLTIKKPIKSVIRRDMARLGDSLSERIRGNYDLMRTEMFPEDLLHLVTQPPEVFLLGGGESSFRSETKIQNIQAHKVEVINNMLNRIFLSADGHLTYQDNAAITTVLHKLGIRDDKTFLQQVYHIAEETKNTKNLLNTYEQNQKHLSELVHEYKQSVTQNTNESSSETSTEVLHLHEDVHRRWEGHSDYETILNFQNSTGDVTSLTEISYRLTEQTRMENNLVLNDLRQMIRGEAVPLTFRNENIYEGDDLSETNVTESKIEERITSAVLLGMVQNLYQNVIDKTLHRQDQWFQAAHTFYRAGDNTLRRIEQNTAYLQTLYEQNRVEGDRSTAVSQELNQIENLLSVSETSNVTNISQSSEEKVFEGADITFETREVTEEENVHVDERNSLEQQLYQINRRNEIRQQQYIKNLQNLTEQYRTEASKESPEERTRREAMMAFADPQGFKIELDRKAAEEREREQQIAQEAEKLWPKETREAFSILREYLNSPNDVIQNHRISVNNESLLYMDTQSVQVNQTETIRKENETLLERERERLRIMSEKAPATGGKGPYPYAEGEPLIHRETEETDIEEFLEEHSEHIRTGVIRDVTDTVRDHLVERIRQEPGTKEVITERTEVVPGGEERIHRTQDEADIEEFLEEHSEHIRTGTIRGVTDTVRDHLVERIRQEPGTKEVITERTEVIPGGEELIHRASEETDIEEFLEEHSERIRRGIDRTVTDTVRDSLTERIIPEPGSTEVIRERTEISPGGETLIHRESADTEIEEFLNETSEHIRTNIERTTTENIADVITEQIKNGTLPIPGMRAPEQRRPMESEPLIHRESEEQNIEELLTERTETIRTGIDREVTDTVRDVVTERIRHEQGPVQRVREEIPASEMREELIYASEEEPETALRTERTEENLRTEAERVRNETLVERTVENLLTERETAEAAAAQERRGERLPAAEITHREDHFTEEENIITETRERLLESEELNERVAESVIANNRVIEKIVREIPETDRSVTEQTFSQATAVNFIHRTSDNTVDEETIEELQREIKRVEQKTTEVKEQVNNREVTEQRVENVVNKTIISEQDEEEISQIVGKSLRSQIDDISNKVYGKIERQLHSERRRRGL